MYYLIICAVLCGFFSAFVAGRKGRNRIAWWFVGTLLPILGVVLSLAVPQRRVALSAVRVRRAQGGARQGRKKPKRCCGSYIPDCFGCPYFRRPLFDPGRGEDKKGYCEFFGRDLIAASGRKSTQVAIEDR
jgi:hypothetical protein